jgi:hypothetical protein
VSGIKTLIHNPQLLWFSVLFGLVMVGLFIALVAFFIFNPLFTIETALVPMQILTIILPSSLQIFLIKFLTVLGLALIEFLTVFCLVFLLAGLVMSLSSKTGGSVSFFHGLALTKKFVKSLTGWSVILALAGTLLFVACQRSELLSPALSSNHWDISDLVPFNYVFWPDLYAVNLPGGARGIRFALTYSLLLTAINMLLFILTLFVVPLIVLGKNNLNVAVSGSLTLIKKAWGEVAVCAFSLGIAVLAAGLSCLLFQSAAGFTGLDLTWRPGDGWIAAGILYVLALFGLACILAAVCGIISRNLYTFTQDRADTRTS